MTVLSLIPQETSYVAGLVEFYCFFNLTLIPLSPPKKYITPTLIPPAARGKFKPEWQTKNHYVEELAPLNRYLFIYLLIYLSLETRGIKKIKISASNWSEWKEEGGRNFQLYWFLLNLAGNNFICHLKHDAPNI